MFASNRTASLYTGLFTAALALALATACSPSTLSSGVLGTIQEKASQIVYRIDIVQGGPLDRKVLKQLRVGLNKEQVLYLLGSPTMPSVFHDGRWDYVFYFLPLRGEKRLTKLTLFFAKDRLVQISRLQEKFAENKAG